MSKKIYLFLLLAAFVFACGNKGLCAQNAQQVLTIGLPQVLSIEKILVEDQQYQRDEPMPNVKVKESRNVDANNTMLSLTPMRVQVRTNSSTPIIISAQFKELKHKEGFYDFNPANLTVEPQSYTINDPYDHVITGIFTPVVDVRPDTAIGMYRGSMYFTLGAI